MATTFFGIAELMAEALQYATIKSIVTIGRSSKLGRDHMCRALAILIRDMLSPYIPNPMNQARFFSVMEKTGGVITGSSTLKIILPCDRRWITAPDLNIVVPKGGTSLMKAFFDTEGYKAQPLSLDPKLQDGIVICTQLRHDLTGMIILITESTRNTVLNVILDGKNTANMNIVSARNIYSFYPEFTASGRAYCGYTSPNIFDKSEAAKWGLVLRDPLNDRYRRDRCGDECPRLQRRMNGLRGVGFVCWNKIGKEYPVLADQRVEWSLGPYCVNRWCPNKDVNG